jgi:hypothetical protein
MIEHSRISLAPDVLVGKPVIRGTRLSVEFVIGLMADGWSEAAIPGQSAIPSRNFESGHNPPLMGAADCRDAISLSKVPNGI